jgi:hypothetical protein
VLLIINSIAAGGLSFLVVGISYDGIKAGSLFMILLGGFLFIVAGILSFLSKTKSPEKDAHVVTFK